MEQSASPLTPFSELWGLLAVHRSPGPGGVIWSDPFAFLMSPQRSGGIMPLDVWSLQTSLLFLTSHFRTSFSPGIHKFNFIQNILWHPPPKKSNLLCAYNIGFNVNITALTLDVHVLNNLKDAFGTKAELAKSQTDSGWLSGEMRNNLLEVLREGEIEHFLHWCQRHYWIEISFLTVVKWEDFDVR